MISPVLPSCLPLPSFSSHLLILQADTLLLAAAGAMSVLLHDDIFFKMKPAVLAAILAAGLAVLLALPAQHLRGWLANQLHGIPISDSAIPFLKRSLVLMAGVLTLHAALVAWAALAWSTAAWGFVSGALLYFLFGALALFQLITAKLKARMVRLSASSAKQSGVTVE